MNYLDAYMNPERIEYLQPSCAACWVGAPPSLGLRGWNMRCDTCVALDVKYPPTPPRQRVVCPRCLDAPYTITPLGLCAPCIKKLFATYPKGGKADYGDRARWRADVPAFRPDDLRILYWVEAFAPPSVLKGYDYQRWHELRGMGYFEAIVSDEEPDCGHLTELGRDALLEAT